MRKPMRDISLRLMVPNIITILAFCSGLTSMRLSLEGRWDEAALAIVGAMILDGLDGRVARLLGATSRFGAILDSLSDLVCFGVAPAFLVYCFGISQYIRFGWSGVMFFTVCMALRLARFNTLDEQADTSEKLQKYFMGVPAPAGALLLIAPICFYLATDIEFFKSLYLNVGMLWLVGLMLVSRIPTICIKSVKIDRSLLPAYGVLFVLASVILYTHIWAGLSVVSIAYLFTIPYTYWTSRVAKY